MVIVLGSFGMIFKFHDYLAYVGLYLAIRAVALDETHEMLVNKDIKTSVVRPSKEYDQQNYVLLPCENTSV